MVSYVESSVINDEKIQYEAKTSIWSLLPYILLGIIILSQNEIGLLFGIGLLLLIHSAIIYFKTELAITDKRVIAKFGFIRRYAIEINMAKIETIQVNQGILGRLFNFGDVIVAGAGNPKATIPRISKPLVFKKRFFELQHKSIEINSYEKS